MAALYEAMLYRLKKGLVKFQSAVNKILACIKYHLSFSWAGKIIIDVTSLSNKEAKQYKILTAKRCGSNFKAKKRGFFCNLIYILENIKSFDWLERALKTTESFAIFAIKWHYLVYDRSRLYAKCKDALYPSSPY